MLFAQSILSADIAAALAARLEAGLNWQLVDISSEDGQVVGSVSGGCVEPAVYEEAMAAIEGGEPRLLSYGISDDEAFGVGLTCGGIIHIFVERVDW